MPKVLLHAADSKGLVLVTSPAGAVTPEMLGEAASDTAWVFESYTDVDSYRLHTLPKGSFPAVKKALKSSGFKVSKVCLDKIPACWRHL